MKSRKGKIKAAKLATPKDIKKMSNKVKASIKKFSKKLGG